MSRHRIRVGDTGGVLSALQVHGRHGRLHVVVGHVGVVVRIVVGPDAGGGADGVGGHVHGLAHGLGRAEGQQIVHGVGGRPRPHHARRRSPRALALQPRHAQARGHVPLVMLRVGGVVTDVRVVGVGHHLGGRHGGRHGGTSGTRVRVELVVQRRPRPGR